MIHFITVEALLLQRFHQIADIAYFLIQFIICCLVIVSSSSIALSVVLFDLSMLTIFMHLLCFFIFNRLLMRLGSQIKYIVFVALSFRLGSSSRAIMWEGALAAVLARRRLAFLVKLASCLTLHFVYYIIIFELTSIQSGKLAKRHVSFFGKVKKHKL